jgi:glycosyltransferase involved in cell wall biosynthesis
MEAGMGRLPRLLWLTTEFYPPETGGTGMIAGRLAQGLAERGVEVRVFTRQTLPRAAPAELVGRVSVRRLNPAGGMKGAGWRALPAMLGFILRLSIILVAESRRYEVVMISGMKTIPLAAVPVCRLLGKRCLIRLESPFELVEPISAESLGTMKGAGGRLMSRILKTAQRIALARADYVIAISQDIAERLATLGRPAQRIARIPNAVDMSRFEPASPDEKERLKNRLNLPPNRTIVLFVGRLSLAKGVMMLVRAWPRILARHPHAYLVLVGTGKGSWDDCEAEIVEFMRLGGLSRDIALAGHSERVQDYLRAADLFVNPSDYEGFSLTLVEALGCGLPVLSTTVGVAPEVIRDGVNGFLCAPKDEPSLTHGLDLALCARARWTGIGQLGREAVRSFDIDRVTDQYLELLKRVGRRSTGHRRSTVRR